MGKILIVGSLNLDFVISVDKMPLMGETILGNDVTLIPGGKGANQSYAAAKLGGDVQMIGTVGKDVYGEVLVDNLKGVGVDTSSIEVLEDVPTGNAFITVEATGDNAIIVIPGANKKLTTDIIDKYSHLIDACDIVIMQLEIPLEVVIYVKQLAKKRGKRIILDPAPAVREFPKDFFCGIDIIKPNETELQTITGKTFKTQEELVSGAKELIDLGVQTVIVTLGGDGCLLVSKEKQQYFASETVVAIDTTAAGDCFTAALAVALTKGKTMEEAIVYGNQTSAIVVTRKGAQTSIPDNAEVEEYYKGGKHV